MMLQGNINSLLHPGTFTIITFISHEYFLKILFAIKTSTSFALFIVSGFRYAVVGMAKSLVYSILNLQKLNFFLN